MDWDPEQKDTYAGSVYPFSKEEAKSMGTDVYWLIE